MRTSFRKVIRDLLGNKGRSITVLLAIVLGAFGVSMMTTAYDLLGKNLKDNYLRTNPTAFTVVVDSIQDSVLQKARNLPNIEFVERRNKLIGRVEVADNEFIPIWLFIVDDVANVNVNTFRLQCGRLPASSNEMLIERTCGRLTDIALNKQCKVTIPGYGTTDLGISGIVHDPGQAPSWMEGVLYGYVSSDFTKRMKITDISSELKFTLKENKYNRPVIEKQLSEMVSFLRLNNVFVSRTEILPPGRHIHQSQMDSLMFLLQMFGVLALILSCFLIINMIMAIMAKEIRQIGVMKAIGASTGTITSIYLRIVLVFGFTATLIALPVGIFAGESYAQFVASMLNFELFTRHVSHGTLFHQIAIGTLLPVLVAFVPIYRASRISVREALNDYGIGDNGSRSTENKSFLAKIFQRSNITLFAVRNTFRRKGRLVLTLITLVLGGAVFITAFNIRESLTETVASRFTNQRYDIYANFTKGVDEASLRTSLDSLPIVSSYETWGYARATRITSGAESELMDVKVVPLQTNLFIPEIIKGQWLAGKPDEVVVNHMFLSKYPDVAVGSYITLRVKGKEKRLKVVGSIRELFAGVTVYVSRSILDEWPEMKGKSNSILLAFKKSNNLDLTSNTKELEQWFKTKQYPVSIVFRKDLYEGRVIDHLVVITTMLIMVTLLLIVVGGLGLITTMGINIMERLRELAILRAIGVTNRDMYQLIVSEGFIIGALSWVIALVISFPLSYYIGNKFFNIFFETTLNFNVSIVGIVLWLGIIVVFSAVAVLVPVRSVNKKNVVDGLSYE